MGEFCPRCLMTEGLEQDPAKTSDTSRFNNPFFHRAFGDYELIQEVARGGMGVIYKARQRSLGRVVALKVLSSGEFASPEFVQRFRAEAAAAARLQHPNIVSIHEVGEHEGVRFFTMDFVEGPNLAQLLAGSPLGPQRAAAYLKTVAEAIHYAHLQGILHRDLKPSNILIDPFGEPRVTDFGLAKEMTGDSDLTVTGQVLGTPGYLPPEQADTTQGPVTPAADVYSLGAVLYYMLTARAPFMSGSLRDTLRQVLTDDPIAPSLLNPEVPHDLETICLKCLERNPDRRYQTARELGEDLGRFLASEPIVARPISPVGRFTRWCRRRPTLAVAWVLAVALAFGSTISAVWISRALAQTQQAEYNSRGQLREARLAEARAVRRTTTPGRRVEALAALSDAAGIRAAKDLRDEAIATLAIPDFRVTEQWDLSPSVPVQVTFDPAGKTAAVESLLDDEGKVRSPANFYHWGQTNSLGTIGFEGTNRAVGGLRFSRDGTLVMARCLDNSLQVWRVGQAQPLLILTNRPMPSPEVQNIAQNDDYDFTPDGSMLVLGLPERGLTLNRVVDGFELARTTEGEVFSSLRCSPDGRRVSAVRTIDYEVRDAYVFNLPDLSLARQLPLGRSPNFVAWSSDSQMLGVSMSDSSVGVWDVADGHLFKSVVCGGMGDGEIMFLANDTLIGMRGAGNNLRVVSLATGSEEMVFPNYGRTPLALLPAGTSFVLTSTDAVATRWIYDPPSGLQIISPPRPSIYTMGLNVCCFDYSPDGKWVVSSHGRFTIIREVATGRLVDELDMGKPSGLEIATVAFSEGGRKILRASTSSGLARYTLNYDAAGWPHFGTNEVLDPEPGLALVDHVLDGRRLALVEQGGTKVKLLDVGPAGAIVLSRWETPSASGGAFSPDGQSFVLNCAATGPDTSALRLRLYRVADGLVIQELPASPSCDATWAANGKVAMTSNGQKQSVIWNTLNWQPMATLKGRPAGDSSTFMLSPDGSYAVVSHDEAIYIVSCMDGSIPTQFELPGIPGTAAGIRFLPDGRRFSILERDGRIDVLDLPTIRAGLKQVGLDW